ncbi:hypothetical protein PENANT_c172G00638 [Penicillium antarcticum]|uniref:Apple domain-containing protein n=1 Tax=Penicillium antarcticum TaxID=416450 RepID=A0A1V6PCL2_9EURO|nr:hypothetical protein PENANT_c172G00638 [Penicillium antarcticum]
MIFQPHLLLPLLGLTSTYAAQTPLFANTDCLSSGDSGPESYKTCCTGKTSGEGFIDGVRFRYTCGKWANPTGASALPATNARECAQLCIQDSSCSVSTFWSSRRSCFLTTAKDFSLGSNTGYLVLEKTSDTIDVVGPPSADCVQRIDEAMIQCRDEEQLKCNKEKVDLHKVSLETCSKEKADLEKISLEQCSKEKSELEQKLKDLQAQTEKIKVESGNDNLDIVAGMPLGLLCKPWNPLWRGDTFPFHGKTFVTTNSDGSRNKWRVHCNTYGSSDNLLSKNTPVGVSGVMLDHLKHDLQQPGKLVGMYWTDTHSYYTYHIGRPYDRKFITGRPNQHCLERIE